MRFIWCICLALFILFLSDCSYAIRLSESEEGSSNWSSIMGGASEDVATSVQATSDGGAIVSGYTRSFGAGRSDAWLIKFSSSGQKVWERTFGKKNEDYANSVKQTIDGGYMAAGYTDTTKIWIVKVDANGETLWEKSLGSSSSTAYSVYPTEDGGGIVSGGWTDRGVRRFYVIKLDVSGNELWAIRSDEITCANAKSVIQTRDGNYFVGGETAKENGDPQSIFMKIGSNGKQLWKKNIDGSRVESIIETNDGHIVGVSNDLIASKRYQAVIFELDDNGNIDWALIPHSGNTFVRSVVQLESGNYLVAGEIFPKGINKESDATVFEIEPTKGRLIWYKNYGGAGNDGAFSISKMTKDKYVVAGYTKSAGAGKEDLWVFTIDPQGNCKDCMMKNGN